MPLPSSIEALIGELAKLPGVGRRSAERMAMGLVTGSPENRESLSAAIEAVHHSIGICETCGYFTENEECLICTPNREQHILMVVEQQVDVIAMEKAGGYKGLYHVLGGHLSPLKGISPKNLRIEKLFERLREPEINEIILATSPSVEGDATALYIARQAEREELVISRLGRGVPMGGSLEFADSGTLRLAVESRRGLSE